MEDLGEREVFVHNTTKKKVEKWDDCPQCIVQLKMFCTVEHVLWHVLHAVPCFFPCFVYVTQIKLTDAKF